MIAREMCELQAIFLFFLFTTCSQLERELLIVFFPSYVAALVEFSSWRLQQMFTRPLFVDEDVSRFSDALFDAAGLNPQPLFSPAIERDEHHACAESSADGVRRVVDETCLDPLHD